MDKRPLISVITAVYNGAAYVEATVRSVLQQTVTDFEYLIVDDASTDDSVHRIEAIGDSRIRLLRNPRNLRLVETRNRALREARGQFVALIDHDDLAAPQRFERQLRALRADPDLLMVGSWAINIDPAGRRLGIRIPVDRAPEEWRASLLFRNAFVNSTLFFRRQPDFCYRHEFPLSEDYDFIVRLSRLGKIGVVPEALISYRIHPTNYSKAAASEMEQHGAEVKRRQLERLGVVLDPAEMQLFGNLEHAVLPPSCAVLAQTAALMGKIVAANDRAAIYPGAALRHVVADELARLLEASAQSGLWSLSQDIGSAYRGLMAARPRLAARVLVKHLIHGVAGVKAKGKAA